MNAHLIRAISQAVEQLIELVQDDETAGEVEEIHIEPDSDLADYTHFRVSVVCNNYYYKYAIYINRETCATECDGY